MAETNKSRDLRLDFCRGLALWFIFLDHIPNNIGSWLTLRNYGFSDSTEIFFFVSGYTCALAYGQTLLERGLIVATAGSLRRALEIYSAFLLLVIFFVALIYSISGLDQSNQNETNTAVLFTSPGPALAHAVSLNYMPVNTDVLATFVVLHALCVPILWLMQRAALLALSASLLLYVAMQLYGINLPTWPKGEWFFNPFAWQFLFAFGVWAATTTTDKLALFFRSNALFAAAIVYLALSSLVVLGWQIKPLANLVPESVSHAIYPIDKSHLDPLRVLHFFSLVLVGFRIIPRDWHWLNSLPARAAIYCGEQPLFAYCASVPLAFMASETFKNFPGSWIVQLGGELFGHCNLSCRGMVRHSA